MKRALFLVAAMFAATNAAAADVAAGQAKAQQVCVACHGPNGDTPTGPDFPKLAGQHSDYLYKAMRDYKSGKRKNAIMAGMAQALSNQEMQDLAAFYASQPGSLRVIR